MAKTLLIKLAETVSGNLPYLGEMNFSTISNGSIMEFIASSSGATIEIAGGDSGAHFTNSAGTANLGTSLEIGTYTHIYLPKNTAAKIRVRPKYALSYFNFCNATQYFKMDLAELYACKSMGRVEAGTTSLTGKITGDIAALKESTGMTILRLNGNPGITGDISALAGMTNLTTLQMNHSSIYGDISVLANMPNLTEVYLHNTSVTGDTSSIAALHPNNGGKLATLNISNTRVTGTWPPSA